MPAALAHFPGADARLLLELFLKATLVLAAAGALALSLRRAPAAARHLVWAVAVAGVVALPFCSLLPLRFGILPAFFRADAPAARTWTADAVPAPLAPPADAAVTPAFAPAAPAPDSPMQPAVASEAPPAAPAMSWHVVSDFGWPNLLVALWLAGAALLVARLLVGMATVWWLARTGEPVTDEEWMSLASRLSRDFWLRSGVRLIRTRWTEMPMTWGVLRPIVLLPHGADEWPRERRELVLTHELAHVVRRDVLTLAVAQVAVALHWFNPLSWIALRQLRAEAERCCDDYVLRAGTRASTYAGHLLDMVRSVGRARVPAALALPMAQRSTFEGRLLAILEPGVDRGLLRRGQAALTALGLAGLVVVLGAMRPAPAPAAVAAAGGDWLEVPEMANETAPPMPAVVAGETGRAPAVVSKEEVSAATREALAKAAPEAAAAVAALAPPADATVRSVVVQRVSQHTVEHTAERTVAVTQLSASIHDSSVEVRVASARALGMLEDPRGVAALIEALRTDQDETVRVTAAWALGQLEARAAVPALLQALSADRSLAVRRNSAWALGQIEDPAAVDGLVRAIRDADAEIRSTAVWALGQIEDRRAVPGLSAALREGDPGIRRQAAWALGQIEDRGSASALVAALRDSDAEVRGTAVWALGQIESPEAVPALAGLLRDGNATVRKEAVWALGQIESESAVQPLGAVLQGDADADVRQTAAWALGQIGKESSLAILSAALHDRSPKVRAQSAWAIGQVSPDRAPPAILAALRDDDLAVRRTAAWALGQIDDDPSTVTALRAALRDADPEVKRQALRALARTGDEAAAAAIAEMLHDPDPQLRAAAAAAMSGRGGFVEPRPQPRPRPRPQPRPRPLN
ncbi:HEAT repeat domain-containing protein [Longimicrobium sp.]|uniref:HEAT repeat domain-containing protein n=1 Tax=Longimicrobium sp. TaxID=2029185 RepID=UPI002CEC7037|nr:HEAT repeat domain-containing protein [Longimicrobium sp.]HSU12773.1 HEAT repeat domain-containing protein [Longimicrobium sp.]